MVGISSLTYIPPIYYKNDGASQAFFKFTEMYKDLTYISQKWHQWPRWKNIKRPPFLWRRQSSTDSSPAFPICTILGYWCKCQHTSCKKMDHSSRMREIWLRNKLINQWSRERHCTLSGRFRGTGSAVTYLWGKGLWAFAAASEEDEVSAPSAWPRPWNLAKRLITENFSRS